MEIAEGAPCHGYARSDCCPIPLVVSWSFDCLPSLPFRKSAHACNLELKNHRCASTRIQGLLGTTMRDRSLRCPGFSHCGYAAALAFEATRRQCSASRARQQKASSQTVPLLGCGQQPHACCEASFTPWNIRLSALAAISCLHFSTLMRMT